MAIVGYLEGTDPLLLTNLAMKGIDTLPISNGVDNHGKHIIDLSPEDGISVVIGYLHKVLPTPNMGLVPRDLLIACLAHKIPVMLTARKPDHEHAKWRLGEAAHCAQLVDPADLYQAVLETVHWKTSEEE